MLATFIWNTLGRCCSSSAAVLPSFFAVSYSMRARCFSRMLATSSAFAEAHRHAVHGGLRVEPGNT